MNKEMGVRFHSTNTKIALQSGRKVPVVKSVQGSKTFLTDKPRMKLVARNPLFEPNSRVPRNPTTT